MAPRILLKARPTVEQIADRLMPPPPEGLELYLDREDLASQEWLDRVLEPVGPERLPDDFALLVEGPVRSLDGAFFDLSADSSANRLLVDRLAECGRAVGARAACVHLIVPTHDLGGVDRGETRAALDQCLPLTRYYAERCRAAGLIPTIENVPPVLRMREGAYMTSPVGSPAEDLAYLLDRVNGLRVTLDTSHAQLFLNAALGSDDGRPELRRLCASMAAASPVRTMSAYLDPLRGRITTAHVSDATGLLGEGLPYGAGAMDLDAAVDLLLDEADWLVTEILEPDPNRSAHMRAAGERIAERRRRARQAPASATAGTAAIDR